MRKELLQRGPWWRAWTSSTLETRTWGQVFSLSYPHGVSQWCAVPFGYWQPHLFLFLWGMQSQKVSAWEWLCYRNECESALIWKSFNFYSLYVSITLYLFSSTVLYHWSHTISFFFSFSYFWIGSPAFYLGGPWLWFCLLKTEITYVSNCTWSKMLLFLICDSSQLLSTQLKSAVLFFACLSSTVVLRLLHEELLMMEERAPVPFFPWRSRSEE